IFQPPKWVGLANYIRLFTRDRIFPKALFNTFYYTFLSVPISMVISLLLALLLNMKLKGMRIFRTIFYLPSLIPVVAMSMVFLWVFAPDTGVLNSILSFFGIKGPAWLLDPKWVKPALVIMSLWGVGGSTLLLIAGLRGIPEELYEAAYIDGASKMQILFKITLPLLSPIIFFNLVMGIIGSLQTFSQVYIMTGGGPNNASTTIVLYLFENAFRFYRMGYASAIAWVLFLIILGFTLIVLKSSALWVFYETEVKK
ncbi:MAG: sugar ABC transporter permease, partial [Thermotogae bacterium]|nr:sugar ABC transporter permease [Thermotogota bacterium]